MPYRTGPDTQLFKVGAARVRMLAGDRVVASVRDGTPFEPHTLAYWAGLCAPGRVVVDAGAYTGLFTISARLLGATCVAFEPLPDNRARLKENARLNKVSASVNEEALSDRVGTAQLAYNHKLPFTSGASLVRLKGTHLPVPTLTLDSLELPALHAVKIDVERAEHLVLAGATETLRRLRPVVIVEALDAKAEEAVLRYVSATHKYEGRMDARNMLVVPR